MPLTLKWKYFAMFVLPLLHAMLCIAGYVWLLLSADDWNVMLFWIGIAELDMPFSKLVLHRHYAAAIGLSIGGTLWWLLINVCLYWGVFLCVRAAKRRSGRTS